MRRRPGSEVATGLLVLVAALACLWGYFWLTAQPLGGRGYPLTVQLADAGGLQRGDRVRLAGVQVGSVRRVSLAGGRVYADLVVDRELDLPRDSRAALRESGAFGGRYLELVPGRLDARLGAGDTVASFVPPGLRETLASVGERASVVLERAADALSPATVGELTRGARSLNRSLEQLAGLSAALRAAADGMRRRVEDGRLDTTAAGLARTSERLAEASADLRRAAGALASVLDKVDRGEGSLGRAVNDPTLYEALLAATAQVDQAARDASSLVRDLRANPGRFVKVSLF